MLNTIGEKLDKVAKYLNINILPKDNTMQNDMPEYGLQKSIRFRCNSELMPAIQVVAQRSGLSASAFMRSVLIKEISRQGWPISGEKAANANG